MIGTIVDFVTNQNQALIAFSTGFILLLAGVLIYLNVFVNTGPSEAEEDLARIEASIEKLLSRAEVIKSAEPSVAGAAEGEAGGAGADESGGGGDSVSNAELLELEAELAEKKREIEKLKEEAAEGSADDNTPELLAKIKNLEDRLAEYEIIEDDIADLSHYKEENARLKKQLESSGGAAPAPATEAAAEEEVEAPPAVDEDAVPNEEEIAALAAATAKEEEDKKDDADIADAVAAMEAENPEVQVAEDPGTPEPALPEDIGDVAEDDPNEIPEPVSAASSVEPVAESPTGEEAPAENSSDDVFAEYSEGESAEGDDPLAALGDIDTNRMLDELKGLDAEAGSSDVLEEQTDVDKMAAEATDLEKDEEEKA